MFSDFNVFFCPKYNFLILFVNLDRFTKIAIWILFTLFLFEITISSLRGLKNSYYFPIGNKEMVISQREEIAI